MANEQQRYFVKAKRNHEAAQEKILKELNGRGVFEHGGFVCWNNPLTDDAEPEAFRPQSLANEFNIIYDKAIGEFRLTKDDDSKKQQERKRRYQDNVIAQRRKNHACVDPSTDKTIWLNITGCADREQPWLKNMTDNPQMLARMVMLACYIHYEDHYIMRQRMHGRVWMVRKEMVALLRLNVKTFGEFWAYCAEHGHIVGDDENGYQLYLPVRYGRIQEYDAKGHVVHRQSKLMQRLYTGAYDKLYHDGGYVCEATEDDSCSFRKLSPRDHYLIGRIMQLAPYIHSTTNILCRNPLCSEDNIEPLSTADIAKLTGIDASHSSRDVDKLCRVTFPVGSSGEETQQYVLLHDVDEDKRPYYIVNPGLIFSAKPEDKDKIRKRHAWVATNKNTGEAY